MNARANLQLEDRARVLLRGLILPSALDVAPLTATPRAAVWPPQRALGAELRRTVEGRRVAVAFARGRDRYARQSAQVFLMGKRASTALASDGPAESIADRWVQALLVERGLARVDVAAMRPACAVALLRREAKARKARRGLWGRSAYAVVRANALAALRRRVGSYQIIEGRIAGVEMRGRRVRLALASRGKSATASLFGLTIWRRIHRALLRDAAATTLVGRRLEVRGWLIPGRVPRVRISHRHQLRLLPASQPALQPSPTPTRAPAPITAPGPPRR
ncbi:MAG: thermonuclease family protein [Pseudomonadota bacterium]